MLAGADITDKTRDYAQSLLEEPHDAGFTYPQPIRGVVRPSGLGNIATGLQVRVVKFAHPINYRGIAESRSAPAACPI